jgi:hypothetical protein
MKAQVSELVDFKSIFRPDDYVYTSRIAQLLEAGYPIYDLSEYSFNRG